MDSLSTRLTFTDEQTVLLDAATSFCREKSTMRAVRTRLTTDSGFERHVWDEMVALGWSGIAVPERFGGSGLSLADVATIAEPMGRHLFATPFASTQIFTQGLLAGGSAEQQAGTLPRICQGAIGTTAVFEPSGDWDLAHIETTAVRHNDAVQLAGSKTFVCNALVADFFLVTVALNGTPALVVLDAKDLPKQRRRREVVVDETQRSFQLELDNLRIPASALITGAAACAALRAIRDSALLLFSAEAAGGIAGALDLVVDYLNTRSAFGRKIGGFQALKHTCAEILVGLERTRSHVYHAASLLAVNEDGEVALRMAKAEAGDNFVFAGDRAIQFHGGFGFSYDCDGQLFLRRALWLQHTFGDAAHHRRHLADLLLSASPGHG
jgi:acyl-CoA dehydrogenase